MKIDQRWVKVLIGTLLVGSSSCSVKQQQDVLASVGTLIPGSRNSMLYPESPPSSTQGSGAINKMQTSPDATQTAMVASPAPRNDLGATDAQLVLRTMQRAMKENPKPFIECLDETVCRSAFTTHLIRL